MRRNVTAQSTMEYVIVLTAIIAAVLVGVLTIKDKSKGLGQLMQKAQTKIQNESKKVAENIVP